MEFVIITGLSGAGKTSALHAMEDIGFYCVDNIPPAIIPAFVQLSAVKGETLNKIAIVTDIRGGELFADINKVLIDLKNHDIDYKILFLVKIQCICSLNSKISDTTSSSIIPRTMFPDRFLLVWQATLIYSGVCPT